MTTLDELLATDQDTDRREPLDDLLAPSGPSASSSTVITAPSVGARKGELPWYERAVVGAGDPAVGAGQFAQHVLGEKASNVLRSEQTRMAFPMVGPASLLLRAASGGKESTTTEEVDASIAGRESEYQKERAGAGQEGLDWWRIGGMAANPMSWLGPARAGAGAWNAIKTGAQQGAFQALLQPVTSEGNFILDKGLQTAIGVAAGGVVSGTLHAGLAALTPAWRSAKELFAEVFSRGDDAAKAAATASVVDDTLKTAGVDTAKMDPNLYAAIRQEVGDSLRAGAVPDEKVIANRADAASLPVPIDLTRGQATRDPMQFSWEVNSSKLRGAGEPLTERISQQNRQLIENLNELGARNAPAPFEASQRIIQHIEGVDAAAKAQVDEAYKAVRDSAGRPALMSTEAFAAQSKNLLTGGRPEMASLASLADYLPETIAKQYNDILSGKLPLTVDTAQFLDRAWGGVQRGTQDATVKNAIGSLRTALNDAPVTDALGEASMAAYQAARQLAKQRFAMIEANPAYKAVVDGVEPDKFFQKYVAGSNVSELAGLKNLIGAENTSMLQQTLVGNLKKIALNRASDENGVFSQSAFNRVLQDPVQGPRLREIFKDSPATLEHLYRLGRVSENVQAFPKGHGVNTSNTAPTAANIIRDVVKSEAGASLWNLIPGGRVVRHVAGEARERAAASKAVDEALTPGVTVKSSKPAAPSPKVRRLSDLLAKAGAIGALAATREEEE